MAAAGGRRPRGAAPKPPPYDALSQPGDTGPPSPLLPPRTPLASPSPLRPPPPSPPSCGMSAAGVSAVVFVLHLPAPLCLTTPSRSSSQLDAPPPPSLLPGSALRLPLAAPAARCPRRFSRRSALRRSLAARCPPSLCAESRPSQPPNVETFHTNGGTFTTDARGRGPARGRGRGRGSRRGRGRSPRRGGGVGPDVVNGALRNLASYLPRVGGSPSAPLTSALALLGNATGEWAEGTSLRPAAVLPVCCACPRTGQVPRLAPARSLPPALPDAQPCNRPSVRTPAQHHLTTCACADADGGQVLRRAGGRGVWRRARRPPHAPRTARRRDAGERDLLKAPKPQRAGTSSVAATLSPVPVLGV